MPNCMASVRVDGEERFVVITIDRPARRNSVDSTTAAELVSAFRSFEADPSRRVAILTGAGGTFCAGADLKAISSGDPMKVGEEGDGPMGPTRLRLSKPVIAAIEGHAVAGGLELALWCDLRVAASNAVMGVFNRRFGIPLVDLGTIRLPRLIGQSNALDLILTGRGVTGEEALRMGLVNRLVAPGTALGAARELARLLAGFPQAALRNDRRSVYKQWGMSEQDALLNELRHGLASLESQQAIEGAQRFAGGEGRHGTTPAGQ
jgi:enoyl-CoA hydratase